jgi:uncharacterized protein YaiI (UPF0178 family)
LEGAGGNLRLFIDADGCPVVDISVRLAKQYQIECLLLCDTSHHYQKDGVVTLTFSKGADSVDFALVNMLQAGDVVVTQDYGLAAMCLARKAIPVHQDGMVYTDKNIDALLLARHTAKKIRNAGGRLKGPSKRTQEQDRAFETSLRQILSRKSS